MDLVIKKLTKYNDDRGWLAEIFRNDEIVYHPAMAYVSVTNPSVVRGPHEHHEQADCFVFIGPGNFELHLWDRREGSLHKDEEQILQVGEDNPTLVIVPPGVVHGYKCIGDIPAYSINFPDKLYKGKNKSEEIDEIRHEQDPNSLYKIL